MFEQEIYLGPGTGSFSVHTFEILIMLLGTFLLGLWLGWLLWSKYKRLVQGIEVENQSLQSALEAKEAEYEQLKEAHNESQTEINQLKYELEQSNWEKSSMAKKLSQLESDLAEQLKINQVLNTEMSQANARNPLTKPVETVVQVRPKDIYLEDIVPDVPSIEDAIVDEPIPSEVVSEEATVPPVSSVPDSTKKGEVVEQDYTEEDTQDSKTTTQSEELVKEDIQQNDQSIEQVDQVEPLAASEPKEEAKPVKNDKEGGFQKVTTQSLIVKRVVVKANQDQNMTVEGHERLLNAKAEQRVRQARRMQQEPREEKTAMPETPIIPTKAEQKKVDDLTLIKGIDDEIAAILYANLIDTYRQLSRTPISDLKEILTLANEKFKKIDPLSWPAQGLLAANNEWENLKAYQKYLGTKN